ncbi:MAG: hypothetical protein E6G19_07680 [Actinobacteria bacterium]|nr:MAG: hypothetical protein E6G19_07680 [Actinomycetota bacterium]
MEKEVHVAEVKAFKTKSGNARFVLKDDEGNEYTTFREGIARQALAAEGGRARIESHEEQRNGYTNVYLDKVEPLEDHEEGSNGADRDAEEVAWRTAVDAAPWLLGDKPKQSVPPQKFFEKLKPFKELVAEDIRDGEHGD